MIAIECSNCAEREPSAVLTVHSSGMVRDVGLAGVDHRLDGEDHARLDAHARAGFAVVEHGRLLPERAPDAVAGKLAHGGEALRLGVVLHGGADVAESVARAGLRDAEFEAGQCGVHQLL